MPKTVGSIPYLYHLHNVAKCSSFSSPILPGLYGAMFHTIWPLYLPRLFADIFVNIRVSPLGLWEL